MGTDLIPLSKRAIIPHPCSENPTFDQSPPERVLPHLLRQFSAFFQNILIFRGPKIPDRFDKSSRSTPLKRDLCICCYRSRNWLVGFKRRRKCHNFCSKAELEKRRAHGCFPKTRSEDGSSFQTPPSHRPGPWTSVLVDISCVSAEPLRLGVVGDQRKTQT